ncbi:MAG: carbon-nitrogen hydrolase family protein [Planctomycetes bacterium]|nr:carbon-nitrogen hydrolase family protein [Planctomycetota bacterium]
MDTGTLKVATCQFGVTADIGANAATICYQMQQTADKNASIVHFSECALSGYASVDFKTFADYNWDLLKSKTLEIIELAGQLNLWVVLGSSHRLTEPNKPHNSLYLISPEGKLVDRYDKRFGTAIDLDNYTPGDHFVHFDINGVKCSLLICFDLRFPELYRALYKDGVKCIFQSFYNARQQGPSIHSEIMRQTMQTNAANNGFRVSMSNSCGWFCPYPSCFIQPDGRIVEQLPEHNEGLMINTVDLSERFYDPSADFRDNAIAGKLTNASEQLGDQRSIHRDAL